MATGAQEEPIFELQDQFGQVHSVVEVAKAPTILIGSDRAGRRLSREWALAVAELLSTEPELNEPVEVLTIADLRGVPGFLKGKVTKQMRRSLSTSILLDWEGQVVGHYGFQPNLANVLLLDRTGSIVIRVASGELQEAEIELLRQALLGLEAPPAPRTSSWNQPILLGSFL